MDDLAIGSIDGPDGLRVIIIWKNIQKRVINTWKANIKFENLVKKHVITIWKTDTSFGKKFNKYRFLLKHDPL